MSTGYVQMEFPFMDSLPKSVAETATSAGFLSKVKNLGNFLIGDWARPVGIEYHALKKEGNAISIFDAYNRYAEHTLTNPKAIDVAGYAAKKTTETATKEVSKGVFKSFFKSAGKLLGKYAIPVLCFAGPVMGAMQELNNGGGIVGAVKELAKGGIGLLGYSAGTLFATAVLGLTTGGWAFVGIFALGALGSMAFDYAGKAILGKSTAEKIAENKANSVDDSNVLSQNLYQQNKQMMANKSKFGLTNYRFSQEMQQAEARFQATKRMFENRYNGGMRGYA